MPNRIFDRILSLSEAAERSGLSESWLRRLMSEGRLEGKKIGKTWLVLAEDVDALAEQERPRGRPLKTLTSAGIKRSAITKATAITKRL